MTKKRKPGPVDAKIERSIKVIKSIDSEVFVIPNTPYNAMNSFGTMIKKDNKITGITWEGCRDRFQGVSEPKDYQEFLFWHKEGIQNNIVDFIRTIEEMVNLKAEERIILRKTTDAKIIYIKFSPWWKYRMRRSLLTALLRCGQEYSERTVACFEKALFSQYYTSQTKPAVIEFLGGRTASKLKKQSGFSGWYQLFAGKKKSEEVRQFLVRLKPKPPESQPKEMES